MSRRDAFDHSRAWPVCYRTQDDAGICHGPLDYPDTDDRSKDHLDMFALGFAIGCLFALAAIDIIEAVRRTV